MSIERLPNLLLIGAPRSGTTSLFTYLSAHPEICPSSIKETLYFGDSLSNRQSLPPISEYSRYFRSCGIQTYRLEASAAYVYGAEGVTKSVRQVLGDVRILVSLREPVERLLSYFRFHKSRLNLDADLSIEKYIDRCLRLEPEFFQTDESRGYWGFEGGKYVKYLTPWQNEFGDCLKILFFDDLRHDPGLLVDQIFTWLDLQPEHTPGTVFRAVNRSTNYRLGWLQRAAIGINDRGEAFWRRYSRIKRAARWLYYQMNGQAFMEEIPDGLRAELEANFEPYNRELAANLTRLGTTALPPWLQFPDA